MKPVDLLRNAPLQPIRPSQGATGPAKQAPNSAQKTPGFSKVLAFNQRSEAASNE